MRSPWTRDELEAIKRQLSAELDKLDAEYPDARPLPPLTEAEAIDLMQALINQTTSRTLLRSESFLIGQLMVQYRMAIEARMLGHTGDRYFVVSESDLSRVGLKAEMQE